MDEIVSYSNFAFGIPSKTSKNDKKNKVMKKIITIAAFAALTIGIASCTDQTPLDEMLEEHTEATSVEDINNHFPDGYGYEELEVTLPVYDRE